MKKKWFGYLGFLSLLGLIGVFTPERAFLCFFAFAVDFQYFFLKSDEMTTAYMTRSAALGFLTGMLVMAAVTLVTLPGRGGREALLLGLTANWVAAVVVYSLATAYHGAKERWIAGDSE